MTALSALAAAYESTLSDRAARGYANGVRSAVLDLVVEPRALAERVARVECRIGLWVGDKLFPVDDYDRAMARAMRDVLTEVGR